jgi:hypothetical protein
MVDSGEWSLLEHVSVQMLCDDNLSACRDPRHDIAVIEGLVAQSDLEFFRFVARNGGTSSYWLIQQEGCVRSDGVSSWRFAGLLAPVVIGVSPEGVGLCVIALSCGHSGGVLAKQRHILVRPPVLHRPGLHLVRVEPTVVVPQVFEDVYGTRPV